MSTPLKLLGLASALALAACTQTPPPAAPEAAAPTEAAPAEPAPAPAAAAVPAPQLQAAMRDLWHGHIVHTRDYALAVHAGNAADAKAAADAVVANAKDIANAVAGFYGQAGGDQMLTLLAGHWGAVQALTDARAKNDTAGADKAFADLTANAGEIAKFLAAANPNLPEDTVRGLLLAHGAHHSSQIDLILKDDTAGEAAEWTAMQAHMDSIADALAAAIAKQFPDKAS
ncbi:hypothetical protein [Cognatiluteimonas weifangensis]|uniref:Lipoprotein n=1 Tax=Cognatiluteimonas weifangensis TaxID=2303539 RepID=A0A372DQ78_9GAMM|nr:hypothetical protein [Luteimonas weifangensis]RFP61577.1 hypothetical protein D0Y53_04515 [Luteimonas weifangensis]